MLKHFLFRLSIILAMGLGAVSLEATELSNGSDDSITFERHIRPILKAHCFHCHGEDGEKEAGIDLRLVRLMKESGAVDSNAPEASMLLEQVESGAMPSGAKKLPDEEIALIRAWLETGLKTIRVEPEVVPDYEITEIERSHWAFQPIVSPSIPGKGQTHPIDALVQAKMTEKGFEFAPTADKVTLLRRASYDLHGVPPTPEAVDAFVNDNEEGGWLRAIDRLLASPHYGERWGRHWLDVVGYADSNGGPKDSTRDHAWHYRDYVVRAFNEDKPWTDFIQEQIAGDELAGITEENAEHVLADSSQWDRLAATGFLRMAPDFTGDDPADFRVATEAVVADNIKVISSAFLGLTVGCAQCHDHRFDPISHVDYFRLRALVDPIYDQNDWRAPSKRLHSAYTAAESAINAKIEENASAVDEARDQLIKRKYHEYLEEKLNDVDENIRDSIRSAWMVPPDNRSEEQASLLEKYDFKFWYTGHLRFLPNCEEEETQREKMVREIEDIRATKISRVFMSATEKKDAIPDTRRFHRGDYRQPKESVGPGDLSIFHNAPQISSKSESTPSSGRRLAYARWLTSGQHPIVARVIVNRFWMQHFGKGLVAQAADFGMRTPQPEQSQLLDYLSAQFYGARLEPQELASIGDDFANLHARKPQSRLGIARCG